MTRAKLDVDERRARTDARWAIVQAVNRHMVRFHAWHPYRAQLLSLRHIQRAVHVARRRGLVKPEVLAAAGYRARAR